MKKDIKKIVAATFEKFPTVDTLYSTLDGNVFIEENRAELHAGLSGKYTTHERTGEDKTEVPPQRSAKELIAEIKEISIVEDLQKYVTDETRKSVLQAVENRIAELTKTAE
ncbi:MAG TPA: hypothetical protein VFD80_07755 [Flavobacteriaceae bacterium]|nr:hypothetical protein [Flavobacteriaceae bacterium]